MMNDFCFVGRLTNEPEAKNTAKGTSITNFTVACQRNFKNEAGEYESDFFNCTAFGKTGETVAKYFNKGSMIAACGEVHIRKYTDRDGNTRYATEINVDSVTFVEKKQTALGGYTQKESPKFEDSSTEEELPFQ